MPATDVDNADLLEIKRIARQLDALDARMTRMLDALDHRTQALVGRVQTIDRRLQVMEARAAAQLRSVNDIHAGVERLQRVIDGVGSE